MKEGSSHRIARKNVCKRGPSISTVGLPMDQEDFIMVAAPSIPERSLLRSIDSEAIATRLCQSISEECLCIISGIQ